jgi:monovalent cation:H+ antiporter-2, CPA2 family
LLKAAGADDAKILIASIDSPEINKELITTVQKHFPQLRIMARARNRMDAYELLDMGLKDIYRESLHTSVKLAVDVLSGLGQRSYTATRQGQKFLQYDDETMVEMAEHRHDMKQYIMKARETFKLQEELLAKDLVHDTGESDHSWDSEAIREALEETK